MLENRLEDALGSLVETEETVQTVETVYTEDLKKYELLTYSLSN